MTSFQNNKKLKFIITLGNSKFSDGTSNQITLENLRASVDIDKAGGMAMGQLSAKIWGVSQSAMNSVTTLQWKPGNWIVNKIEVFAIDGEQETLIFSGNIVNSWGDYQSMPDVFLNIQAQSAYQAQIQSVKPLSVTSGVNVAVLMGNIAKEMGLSFENNNVSVIMPELYLSNSLTERAKDLAAMANFDLYIDDVVLAITNRYAPRDGLIPLISPYSGLVGYPNFDGVGVTFRCLFNPGIIFGGLIKLDTSIPTANGDWIVTSISHQLESEKPSGAWFSTIRGNANGLAVTSR